jgi:TonB family protein
MSRAPHSDSEEFSSVFSWQEPVISARLGRAAIVSIAIHLVLFAVFWAMPKVEFKNRRPVRVMVAAHKKVIIYAPPRIQELTQKAPNVGKVTNELDVRSTRESKPAPRSFRPPAPAGPADRPPAPAPSIAPPDLDLKIEAPAVAAVTGAPSLPRAPESKPKFENVAPTPTGPADDAKLKMPKATQVDVATNLGRAGGGGGTISSGNSGDPSAVGNMQLLSDPQNVDFKPYMQQVLSLVRRQWFAVIPQIARTGKQGIVVLQFSVDRRGQVPKLVIANPSGTVAFDQAAVASVSASNPFPPLPSEYQGTEIRLQLAFSYNVPRAR